MRVVAPMFLAAAVAATPARADDAQVCIERHEAGLADEARGALQSAREHFKACSEAQCPTVVRDECVERIEAIGRSLPTVVLAVTDASGNDVAEGRVFLDDGASDARLDGLPIPLDPGRHRIRVESAAGAGEVALVARLGERNRVVAIELVPPADVPARTPPPSSSPWLHPAAWVAGGVGLAGLAVFAVAGGLGRAQESSLDACRPRCTEADVGVMRDRYLAADIGLLMGGLGVASAVILGLVLTPEGDVTVESTGVGARLTVRF